MQRPQPESTRTDTLFPYTTLCRSQDALDERLAELDEALQAEDALEPGQRIELARLEAEGLGTKAEGAQHGGPADRRGDGEREEAEQRDDDDADKAQRRRSGLEAAHVRRLERQRIGQHFLSLPEEERPRQGIWKSVVWGKRVSVRVALGCRRCNKNKKHK